jgi:hypothetical protein
MHSSISNFKPFVAAFMLCFAVLGVGGFIATEVLIRTHVVANHNKYAYLELFRRTNTDGASFGDSMMETGLIGRPGMLNLAQGGEAYFSMERRINLYLENHAPRRIIIEAGVHHFAPSWSNRQKSNADGFESVLRDDGSWICMSLHPFHKAEVFLYWEKWLDGSNFASTRTLSKYGGVSGSGDYSRLDAKFKRVSSRQEAQYWSGMPAPGPSQVGRQFRVLLHDMKNRGIEVCMVTPPAAELMREHILKKPIISDVEAFFQGVANELNFTYANFLRFPLDDKFYSDPSHLNHAGAKLFTDLVHKACFASSNTNIRP